MAALVNDDHCDSIWADLSNIDQSEPSIVSRDGILAAHWLIWAMAAAASVFANITIIEWSGWHQCCVSMSQVHCHWWCLTPHQSHLLWIKSWRMINYCITCQRRNQCKYKLGKRWNLDCWMFVHEVVYWLTCEQTHCMIILQQSNSRDLCLGSYFEPFTQSLGGDHAAI